MIFVTCVTCNLTFSSINLEHASEGCDLDFVPFTARERRLDYVLNNSFGFGGTNASVIFGRI